MLRYAKTVAQVLPLFGAVLLQSCASAPHLAPRFNKPSTVPLAAYHKKAATSIASAHEKIVQLETEVPPELKLQVASVKIDLDSALSALTSSEGARSQLETQLTQQTTQANQLSDSYDKEGAQIVSLKASRHRWVKYFAVATGLLLLSLVWIFKRPLLLLIGI